MKRKIGKSLLTLIISPVLALIARHSEWIAFSIILAIAVIANLLIWFGRERSSGPVQVYLPDWENGVRNDFFQDGVIQKQGFDQAGLDAEHGGITAKVQYYKMNPSTTAENLLEDMKAKYNKGSQYFVITMSSKAVKIMHTFGDWHNSFTGRSKRKAPVLIVTVASVPGLAKAKNGIVRWYIRSEEESRLLANYLRQSGYACAAAFGVTHHVGTTDSDYGCKGIEKFCAEFKEIGGTINDDMRFYATADSAKDVVKEFLNNRDLGCKTGVFVVGYGDMVKNTLHELITGGYEGCIVCTSTLTDKQWQPTENWDKNKLKIFTMIPRLKNPHQHLAEKDRQVVYYFARKTLLRVLRMAQKNFDAITFLDQWTEDTDEESKELELEYFKCGDVLVHSRIVSLDQVK